MSEAAQVELVEEGRRQQAALERGESGVNLALRRRQGEVGVPYERLKGDAPPSRPWENDLGATSSSDIPNEWRVPGPGKGRHSGPSRTR